MNRLDLQKMFEVWCLMRGELERDGNFQPVQNVGVLGLCQSPGKLAGLHAFLAALWRSVATGGLQLVFLGSRTIH